MFELSVQLHGPASDGRGDASNPTSNSPPQPSHQPERISRLDRPAMAHHADDLADRDAGASKRTTREELKYRCEVWTGS
jgi:hypothetical protein